MGLQGRQAKVFCVPARETGSGPAMATTSTPLTADALAALGCEAADAAQTEARDWETMSAASLELIEGIPKGAYSELKAFAKPPAQIHQVLVAVAMVLGESNT